MIPALLLALSAALLGTARAATVTLTTAELALHDTAESCWMLVDGTVYDVTAWIAGHPGQAAILRGCGKDASLLFEDRDGQGTAHSPAARQVLAAFALGPLGAAIEVGDPPATVHPHALRLEGSRAGLLPTSGLSPRRSVLLRVVHHFSTAPDRVGNGMVLSAGYSFGPVEVALTDVRGPGIGGLELKARPLNQHGKRQAPLSVALGAGGGYATEAAQPVGYGMLVLERDLLDRRLVLRGDGILATGPGLTGSLGGGMELRPLPIHGLFVEAQVPLAAPERVAWSAGARLFTRAHTFAVYAASTPEATPWELAGPSARALAIGASFERAFAL